MTAKLIPTPAQTVGPFFHLGLARAGWGDLTADGPEGERIIVEGRVIDGAHQFDARKRPGYLG